jgi:glyoxylase-like metal-dependent hydrolase (beta-lactamase superfamily II)
MLKGGNATVVETEIKGIVRYAFDNVRIYRIRVESLPGHRTNIYLILDGDEVTLVDVGFFAEKARDDIEKGFDIICNDFKEDVNIEDITNVVITHGHGDHFGMLANNRLFGKRVYIHPLDSNHIKDYPGEFYKWKHVSAIIARESGCYINPKVGDIWTPDKIPINALDYDLIEVDDGQEIINGYEVYHTPGHSPGHICLKVGPVLFLGDHILSFTTPHQSPKTSWEGGGLGNYLTSLKKVAKFEVVLGLPGHENSICAVKDRAQEIDTFHHQRLEELLGLCEDEKSLYQLTKEYYMLHTEFIQAHSIDDLVDEEKVTALQEIMAHVEYLLEHDTMMVSNIDNGVIKYCSKSG